MVTRRTFVQSLLGASAVGALGIDPGSISAQATPTSSATADVSTLSSYLSLSPLSIARPDIAMPLLMGDAQLQADALGVSLPVDPNDPEPMHEWIQSMFYVALPSFVLSNGMRDDFLDLTGFQFTELTSGAEIGEPPDMVTFLRGSFDPFRVQTAQLLQGYQQIDVDGQMVYSLHEDDELDLTHPVQAMFLARANNSTILEDGTLVYASKLDSIRAVLAPESTLDSIPQVQQALATLDGPLITAALLGPSNFLAAPPMEMLQATAQDEIAGIILAMRDREPMPVVLTAIAGSTPGGPTNMDQELTALEIAAQPRSLSKIALVYASAEEAERAAELIDERLSKDSSVMQNRPFTDYFSTWSIAPNPANQSVLVTLQFTEGPSRILDFVFRRDLGFISG